MKKIICLGILKIILLTSGYGQNSNPGRLLIPPERGTGLLKKTILTYDRYVFSSTATGETNNNFLPFLNNQPFLKIPAATGKHVLIFTEFSFTDIMENTINNVDARLLYKYDDQISELFRDAPSLFKLKCIIGL